MSNYDRGPYTPPSEPPLSFDPRQPVRGAGPVPLTLIVSALVLVGLVGAVAFIYRGGLRHHGGDGSGLVGTPVGAIASAPPPDANSAGPQSSLTVVKTSPDAPAFVPPPETPAPRPVVTVTTLTPPPPPPPPPTAATPVAAPPPSPPAKPLTIASLANAAESAGPPVKLKPALSPAAVTPSAAPSAAPVGAGWVQIGAYSSAALADAGWTSVARLEPAAMAGKGKRVEAIARDGKTLYRTYITGFDGKAAAGGFCDRLKAAGKACFVK